MRELFPKYSKRSKSTSIYLSWRALSPADSTIYRPHLFRGEPAYSSGSLATRIRVERSISNFTVHFVSIRSNISPSSGLIVFRLANITKGTFFNFDSYDISASTVDSKQYEFSLDCAKDDYIELQVITPTWSTNPSDWRAGFILTY